MKMYPGNTHCYNDVAVGSLKLVIGNNVELQIKM